MAFDDAEAAIAVAEQELAGLHDGQIPESFLESDAPAPIAEPESQTIRPEVRSLRRRRTARLTLAALTTGIIGTAAEGAINPDTAAAQAEGTHPCLPGETDIAYREEYYDENGILRFRFWCWDTESTPGGGGGTTDGRPVQAGETVIIEADPNRNLLGNITIIPVNQRTGFVTVFDLQRGNSGVSSVNTMADRIASNSFAVGTGINGQLGVDVTGTTVHVLVDGIEVPRSEQIKLEAKRLLDTRWLGSRYEAGTILEFNVGSEHAGRNALLNVTVDAAVQPGFGTLMDCDGQIPEASSINMPNIKGVAIASLNLLPIPANGRACLLLNVSAAGVVVDLVGSMGKKGNKVERIIDTRKLTETVDKLRHGEERIIETGVPNGLAVFRVTTTRASDDGFVQVFPTEKGQSATSELNFDQRDDRSKLVIKPTDINGRVSVKMFNATVADFTVDFVGVYTEQELGFDPSLVEDERWFDSRNLGPVPQMR